MTPSSQSRKFRFINTSSFPRSKGWQLSAYRQEFQLLPPKVFGQRFADGSREWNSYFCKS